MSKVIRNFVNEILREIKVSASVEYMKKEAVMQAIQRELASHVRLGKIKTKKQMDQWLDFYLHYLPPGMDSSAAELAVMTLKSIPDPNIFKLPGSVSSEKL
jgi:Ribonuclease G/E